MREYGQCPSVEKVHGTIKRNSKFFLKDNVLYNSKLAFVNKRNIKLKN